MRIDADDIGGVVTGANGPEAGVWVIAETNDLYREAARVTIAAVDEHLGRPRLTPMGGLYTVVDVGTDADAFVPKSRVATDLLPTLLILFPDMQPKGEAAA